MTVAELKQECDELLAEGKGDMEVLLCVRGNEFHALNMGFSSAVYNDSAVYDAIEENEMDENETIILN